ncbi:MAG TPA: cysteine desulfurase [Candidatus Bathyarchaeia archaeon]|nr:cysteine desulfurase [Candidatus Bathyarchaeia archaeon]
MHRKKRYDVDKVRHDFPILKRIINKRPLAYLDNAATTQKPRDVIDEVTRFYNEYNANVHRGVYKISEEATAAYEEARAKIARLINASSPNEIIFVRGTTEAINLVAQSWGRSNIGLGDGIILTEMEHHSNIVPWQLLATQKGAHLKYVGLTDDGHLVHEDFRIHLESGGIKLVAMTHVSNVLGTINPVREYIREAHKQGCRVLLDAAQSVPHIPVDVQDMDCDFLAFSGHKMCGPTGIGVLYAKKSVLEEMPPYHGGGEMIREVHLYESTWRDPPYRFEAGTTNIAGAIGLGKAVDYLSEIGLRNIQLHDQDLTEYAHDKLGKIKGVKIYGPENTNTKVGVISFNLGDVHAHDMATLLDEDGIAVRSGHHCAQPLMDRLGVTSTTRASFYIYNVKDEIDRLVGSVERAAGVFKV